MSNFLKRILSSIILIPLVFFSIIKGSYIIIIFISLCFLIVCYEWHTITKKLSHKIFGLIFYIVSFYIFYLLSKNIYDILFVIIISVSTDIGGYSFGKIFKGPKLTKISPNKTYVGVFGAYCLTFISIVILHNYLGNSSISFINLIIIIFLLSTVSQIGDLIVSFFKREAKIKNTGRLIPGHGGLLDRVDGLIFVVPTFYFIKLIGFFDL